MAMNEDKRRGSYRAWRLKGALLLLWLMVTFGSSFFARDIQTMVAGWPLEFWIAAQGAMLVFVGIVTLYAWLRNRQGDEPEGDDE
jgi:cation/acetate symporter